ncbi:MAG TPA: CPBP family intramembrane glutamic endopeptidase [Candidatus Dormibacteraeota bacterium]
MAWDQEIVLLLPLPLIVLFNLGQLGRWSSLALFNRLLLWALPALIALYGVLAVGAGLTLAGLGLLLAAIPVLLVQLPAVMRELTRVMPFDAGNQVHRLALVLTVAVVATQLATQLTTDVLAQASSGGALGPLDLLLQELPFLLAAVLGVGIWIRRRPPAVAARLGWRWPTWWQVVLGLAAAGAFYAFGNAMDQLSQWLTPHLADRVNVATSRLFGRLDNPLGIATIALAAGVCEEALFRGALQPRLGLIWTAVVFASVHSEYGLSLDTAAVLVLAVGLGLIRRFTNTSASTVTHVTYNALVGAGLGWIGLLPALVLEAALCLLLLGYGWRRWRSWRSSPPAEPLPAFLTGLDRRPDDL